MPSPSGSNTDMDFQIKLCCGGETNQNVCSSSISCMQNRSAGGKKTDTVGVNPQQEKQRTAGASIMNKSAPLCCEKKLRKSEVILTL